jgi:hypothetical protein
MMSWRSYKTLLKPIFKAISKPGIGNPHTPYEAELMAIGAKPVAIMSPSDITPDLQLAIDNGDVVKTGEKLFREHFRIYHRNDQNAEAALISNILSHAWNNHEDLNEQQAEQVVAFFALDSAKGNSDWNVLLHAEMSEHLNSLKNSDRYLKAGLLLEGHMKGLAPVRIDEGYPENKQLEKLVQTKRISALDFNTESCVQVYAQAAKVEDGRELFARYYSEGVEDYTELDNFESHKRVAHLLGFTENDFAWFWGTKYQNPVIKRLMYSTNQIRAKARREYMKSNISHDLSCE